MTGNTAESAPTRSAVTDRLDGEHARGDHVTQTDGCTVCARLDFSDETRCLMLGSAGKQCINHLPAPGRGGQPPQCCWDHADDATMRRAEYAAATAIENGDDPAACRPPHLARTAA